MKYNEAHSPLLRLPNEIRNKIFLLVVVDQHVHVSVDRLPEKPAEDADFSTFTMEDPPKYRFKTHRYEFNDNRYDADQRHSQPP
jgi:hypothetical protein